MKWLHVLCLLGLSGGGCSDSSPADPMAEGGVTLEEAGRGSDASGPSDAGSDASAALVHSALWEVANTADDPFFEKEQTEGGCSRGAYGEESLGGRLVFFVRTSGCAYLTVQQASRAPLRAGDRVELELLQFPLTLPEGSISHLAVQIGEELVFERQITVPADMQHFVETWTTPHAVAEGTPVTFHVHNHGTNEYALLGLTVLGGAAGP